MRGLVYLLGLWVLGVICLPVSIPVVIYLSLTGQLVAEKGE